MSLNPIAFFLILAAVGTVAFLVGRYLSRRAASSRPAFGVERLRGKPALREIWAAVEARDGEAIEVLRGAAVEKLLPDLVDYYGSLADWERKDLVIWVVCDHSDPVLIPIYKDALDSPTAETRGLAVSALGGDDCLFDSFVVNSFVDASRVDAAVAAYRASQKS